MLLSNLVSEMVIVTVPPALAYAAMAPPYKVDVPPPNIYRKCHLVSVSPKR